MYKKEQRITNGYENLDNYIENYDVFNSQLLLLLNDPNLQREIYRITTYEFRPDLIAREFYGSEGYMGILMIQVALGLEGYTKDTILELIPKSVIDEIIKSL